MLKVKRYYHDLTSETNIFAFDIKVMIGLEINCQDSQVARVRWLPVSNRVIFRV